MFLEQNAFTYLKLNGLRCTSISSFRGSQIPFRDQPLLNLIPRFQRLVIFFEFSWVIF